MDQNRSEPGTRAKILIAAATMLGENPTARLSVRAVAARAQVSTGSLRHFFPTQRALVETVVAAMSELEIPDDPMADRSLPPAERLLRCLQLLLQGVGTGERARQQMRGLYEAYIASPPTLDESATFFALDRLGRQRIEKWLAALVEEGVAPADRIPERARFLSTVTTGLMTERALPSETVRVDTESETLRLAVRAVLGDPPPASDRG